MTQQDGPAYCPCESFARVTERAAVAAARWLGRADMEAAAGGLRAVALFPHRSLEELGEKLGQGLA